MKTMFKSISMLAVAACAGMSIASCTSEKDYYDPEVIEQNVKAEYAANFVKTFGAVSPTKIWDLSVDKTTVETRSASEISYSFVDGFDFGVTNGKVTKNQDFYNAITKTILPEGVTKQGQYQVLLAPDNDFTIYPLSTQTGATYKMYVKIGDTTPIEIFDKNWNNHEKNHVNGMMASMRGLHVDAPVGTPIEIWMDRTDNTTPNIYGTTNGMAITVESDVRPVGVDEDAVIKYVGIEDWGAGDHDYNDLVIAIVGNPDAPEPVIIKDEYYFETLAHPTKRYMIEDLGDTDDFDFNDVVVDVKDLITVKHHVRKENGLIVSDNVVEGPIHHQKAEIRAMGGTLDVTLKIGDTTWTKSTKFTASQMYNTKTPEFNNVLDEFEVTGWDYINHNIIVTVNGKTSDHVINFPATGAVPMIIATSPRWHWMEERVHIPVDWTK